ncbi:hypothetical protein EDB92DRAFT_2107751 [Lactarius akahatsu]|uniref:Uncharacterized protein n=1 Tax=Lactarius akahatsu TaxID=416441 RepID=A0AAD4Q583_9AGAM|nr:hypothetical protein EDB92DRAFT_2107751 [Lactarius akahatsu]
MNTTMHSMLFGPVVPNTSAKQTSWQYQHSPNQISGEEATANPGTSDHSHSENNFPDSAHRQMSFSPPTSTSGTSSSLSIQCPHHVKRIGVLGDGGKYTVWSAPRSRKNATSTRINCKSSFGAALLGRAPGCEVWGTTPLPWTFVPEIEITPNLTERAHVFPKQETGNVIETETEVVNAEVMNPYKYNSNTFYTLEANTTHPTTSVNEIRKI